MKVLSNEQLRTADRATIERQGISSLELMEQAAERCADFLLEFLIPSDRVAVMAGMGNNGGDALVISRLLLAAGLNVETVVLRHSEDGSEDFQTNLDRLHKMNHDVRWVDDRASFFLDPHTDVLIDGVFGSGLSRPLEGWVSEVIDAVNGMSCQRIAIDTPSGFLTDEPMPIGAVAIEADLCLCLQVPRLGMLLPSAAPWVNSIHVIDIGLDHSFLASCETPFRLVEGVGQWAAYFARPKHSHKGSFGHALLVAGSEGMEGAAIIATAAALQSGAGKVTAYTTIEAKRAILAKCPEAMVRLRGTAIHPSDFEAILMGPGMGTEEQSASMLQQLLSSERKGWVLDADALNVLSQTPEHQRFIPKHAILTPHIGEFERLFGSSENEFERIEQLRKKAQELEVFIVLKGAHSALATPEGDVYFNHSGTPALAKAGSGDVLAGLVTSLLAQCEDPFVAAVVGMHVHGLAGELAAADFGLHGALATHVCDRLGIAINSALSRT